MPYPNADDKALSIDASSARTAGALPRFMRIESLKADDAFLQPLDATPLLSDGQDWRFGLGGWQNDWPCGSL